MSITELLFELLEKLILIVAADRNGRVARHPDLHGRFAHRRHVRQIDHVARAAPHEPRSLQAIAHLAHSAPHTVGLDAPAGAYVEKQIVLYDFNENEIA